MLIFIWVGAALFHVFLQLVKLALIIFVGGAIIVFWLVWLLITLLRTQGANRREAFAKFREKIS